MTDPKENNPDEIEPTPVTEPPVTEEAPAQEPIAAEVPPVADTTPPPTPEEDPSIPDPIQATLGNRVLAALIDSILAGLIAAVIPGVGILIWLAYMLTRDSLPFLEGQSIGKKIIKLRAVSTETGKPLTNDWNAGIVRNVPMVIPLFPLVELIILSGNKDGQRLGDQWAKTKVIVDS